MDIEEGADIIMVKPAMSYLDMVSEISKAVECSGSCIQRKRRVRHGKSSSQQWAGSMKSALSGKWQLAHTVPVPRSISPILQRKSQK